jgi:hypothetical protein
MLSPLNWHFAPVYIEELAIKLIVISFAWFSLFACTPAFNWRDVSFEQAPVTALLPCKPDRGSRQVSLGGQAVQMHMAGCESGGAMFTLSLVEVPESMQLKAVADALAASSKATHSKTIMHGKHIAQAAIYGQPTEGRDGPGALSAQAVDTFLSSLNLVGAK